VPHDVVANGLVPIAQKLWVRPAAPSIYDPSVASWVADGRPRSGSGDLEEAVSTSDLTVLPDLWSGSTL
jgi:hypothetical protein